MGQQIANFWETYSDTIVGLGKNLGITIIIIIAGSLVSKGLQKLIKKSDSESTTTKGTLKPLFKAIIRYGIFIICVIMILNVFGINTTSLLAILGAAGIAVGLALKDTLGNIASGIMLLVMGSIHVDEFIEFGSFSGTVKEINLFTTILETPDGIYVSAPNSSIWGSPIKNYTRNGKRRMELTIGIAYSDSVETAFDVMQNIINTEERFLADPSPQIILQSIEDSSVKITLRIWAAVPDYWALYWEKKKILKTKFEEAGLTIPLPQRNVKVTMNE